MRIDKIICDGKLKHQYVNYLKRKNGAQYDEWRYKGTGTSNTNSDGWCSFKLLEMKVRMLHCELKWEMSDNITSSYDVRYWLAAIVVLSLAN